MGRYSIEEIKSKMVECINFLNTFNNTDVFTYAFWVMSYLSYSAALVSGIYVVNANVTGSCYSDSVYDYRNAYAHNESQSTLRKSLTEVLVHASTDWADNDFIRQCIEYLINYDFGGELG